MSKKAAQPKLKNNDGYAVYGRICRAVQSAIRHYLRKWCEFYKYKNEMTFPKRKKSSRFQTILIKKKEKTLTTVPDECQGYDPESEPCLH